MFLRPLLPEPLVVELRVIDPTPDAIDRRLRARSNGREGEGEGGITRGREV